MLRALANYPDALHEAAETRAPQKISTWVRDFAAEFHGFYRDCKVLSDDAALTQARLWLTEACRVGLANALARARRERARRDDPPRRRRSRGVNAFDLSLLPVSATTDPAGRVAIAGVDLASLAEEFGTPLFVYDEDDIRQRCRAYRAALGDGVAYASKAFLCTAMARVVHEEGLHLDVATGGELFVALNAGFPAERIVFHGNNKSTAELRRALEAGVGRIAVDSADELEPARGLGGRGPSRAPRAYPGHPGCRGAHPRVHRNRHRGLEVRLRPRQR